MNQKPKGILFKCVMIRALLNTQHDVWPAKAVDQSKPWKWQTRRIVDMPSGWSIPPARFHDGKLNRFGVEQEQDSITPPHPAGAILYAKETFGYTTGKSQRLSGQQGRLSDAAWAFKQFPR